MNDFNARHFISAVTLLTIVSFGAQSTEAQFFQRNNQRQNQQQNQPQSPTDQQNRAAEEAYQKGDFDKTIQLCDTALRRNRNNDVAYYLRGSAKVELGLRNRDTDKVREGIADAREAIRIRGRESTNYYLPYLFGMTNLSIIEERDDHAEVSIQIAEQTLKRPNMKAEEKSNVLYQKGYAEAYLKKTEDAVASFDAAIRLNPKLLAAYTAAADALARAGEEERAEAAFDRAVKAFPDQPLVHNNRGMFLQQHGKADQSIGDFTKAIQLDPKYFYSYTNRGFALLKTDDPAAAEADFTKSLQQNPNQPMVYGLRGTARLEQKKFDEAIADHEKAVEMVPGNAVAHADLAFAYFFAGSYDAAINAFDNALKLQDTFKHLIPWKVEATREAGQEADPNTDEYSIILATTGAERDWVDSLVAFTFGRLTADELLTAVTADEKIAPAQTCEAHYFIARKLLREGKEAEAKEHFEKALATNQQQLSAYRGAKLALK
ncbi:tetratricopeptide repeat protein [Calycomorphotria hydatis]|uniref:Lipoprotein NlpI n=1 Tax=Calycomorphotria hydatis TaxID=2528027 RepID=A0A517TCU5_9PLAN|nr:tetratricopeptide repeat protein [Calycomorphotria hydatis]QDT66188.1 Lipoprotein NlpI precursor [Calycomorphotria hydatis]